MSANTDDIAPLRRQARTAGVLYLLVALIAPFGLIYVPNKLFVAGNVAATAAAIRASEDLLRLGIASELVHQAIEVFLVLALYRIFKPIQQRWAMQMMVLGLVPIPIVFLNTLNEFAVINLLAGVPFLDTFTSPQLEALAYLFMRLHSLGLTVASVFWGLWLLPLGALAFRSGFIPRVVGVLAALAGVSYVLDATVRVIAPSVASTTFSQAMLLLQSCELVLILWLVAFGAKRQPTNESRRAGKGDA
jgi:hypothetical protein